MLSIPKCYFCWDSVCFTAKKKPKWRLLLRSYISTLWPFAYTHLHIWSSPTRVHCCALHCALTYSLAGRGEMRGLQRGAAVTMSTLASCQFQTTSVNKLFISCTWYSVSVFFQTCFRWKGRRTSFGGSYGKKEAGESVFCLPPSVFLTYSLSHQTCKQAVITLQLPTCWLSPNLPLCLFIHFLSHLTLLYL